MPVALVTGGRRGIGRGIALALAEAGFDLVILDLARDADAAETLAAIEGLGRRAAFVEADISDLPRHAAVVAEAWTAFGRIDCLVNNAGVSVAIRGDLLEVTAESFDRVLDINLRGTFFFTQAIAREMTATAMIAAPAELPRSIIVISSTNAEAASPDRGEYCIAKAGLAMLVKLFALRLAEAGIAVFEIRPGIIRTGMTEVATAKYDRLIGEGLTPIARWGEPADIGRAVATLATGGMPFATGVTIEIDGGLHIRRL